jgi:hypothetical protein
MSYTCPKCGATSYNPNDEFYGYCGNCHQFTRGVRYGDQRHRSSSTPAGQEREMRMPTNDEEGKAQPEMPEVQRQGNCRGVRDVSGERMERSNEPLVRTLQRIGVYNDRMMTSYENMRRLTRAERWLFASVGMTCGISFTNLLHVLTTPDRAVRITTVIIIFMAFCQLVYVYRGMKRLKAQKRELEM